MRQTHIRVMNKPANINAPFNIAEAKAHFSELVTRAAAGEEIVIARSGKPLARLVPLAEEKKKEPRRIGIAKHWKIPDEAFEPLDPATQAIMEGEATDAYGIWVGLPDKYKTDKP